MTRRQPACLLPLLLVGAISAHAAEDPATTYLKRAVAHLAALHSDGLAVGSPKFRHIQYGPLLSEQGRDAVVLFNLEGFLGGNHHAEYLAIFEDVGHFRRGSHRSHPYRLIATLEIGGREWRSFDCDSLQVRPGLVSIPGKAWALDDALCCPSKPFSTRFRIEQG